MLLLLLPLFFLPTNFFVICQLSDLICQLSFVICLFDRFLFMLRRIEKREMNNEKLPMTDD